MLHKLEKLQYSKLVNLARTHDCGCVYPLSVTEEIQDGDIYIGSDGIDKNILIWTQSGFAYLLGIIEEKFLKDIYKFMLESNKENSKRFL